MQAPCDRDVSHSASGRGEFRWITCHPRMKDPFPASLGNMEILIKRFYQGFRSHALRLVNCQIPQPAELIECARIPTESASCRDSVPSPFLEKELVVNTSLPCRPLLEAFALNSTDTSNPNTVLKKGLRLMRLKSFRNATALQQPFKR
jgi:hypothetical protein